MSEVEYESCTAAEFMAFVLFSLELWTNIIFFYDVLDVRPVNELHNGAMI